MNGMACHAAHNLIADKNSVIHLNCVDLDCCGNYRRACLARRNQKEVGISFKTLSAQVQQNIADWMARESQPANRAGSEQGLQAKTMSPLRIWPFRKKKTILRSLSAALALSRDLTKGSRFASATECQSFGPSERVEASGGIFPLAPTEETFPAMRIPILLQNKLK